MDFKITGIPQYSINDSFRKFQESLENVTTIGFGAIRGNLVLDGNNYLIGVDQEAYSAAGKTWFGWWLVEHYFSYHVDCPDGCGLGEPARGRKDPPYFQMGYGSFDNIPDLVDSFVESFLPVQ